MQDWERIWRGSGVVFVVLTVVAFLIYGSQPKLGASPAELLSFFHGDRTRILIATVVFCVSFLELLWFGRRSRACCVMPAWPAGAQRRPPPAQHWGPSGSFV
jgi:hypothetical protein